MKKSGVEEAVGSLILALGEDLERSGLRDTPKRVASFLAEFSVNNSRVDMTYPKKFIKLFDEPTLLEKTQIITVRAIPFCSLCEHHLMPFFGTADISYIPSEGKILGISKFSRIVNYFSKKLQNQERLTEQIANFLFENIPMLWLKVEIAAEHMCMAYRGTMALGSKTKTEVAKGEKPLSLNL